MGRNLFPVKPLNLLHFLDKLIFTEEVFKSIFLQWCLLSSQQEGEKMDKPSLPTSWCRMLRRLNSKPGSCPDPAERQSWLHGGQWCFVPFSLLPAELLPLPGSVAPTDLWDCRLLGPGSVLPISMAWKSWRGEKNSTCVSNILGFCKTSTVVPDGKILVKLTVT